MAPAHAVVPLNVPKNSTCKQLLDAAKIFQTNISAEISMFPMELFRLSGHCMGYGQCIAHSTNNSLMGWNRLAELNCALLKRGRYRSMKPCCWCLTCPNESGYASERCGSVFPTLLISYSTKSEQTINGVWNRM